MPSKPASAGKKSGRSNRARLDELRRQQQRAERRRTMLFVGGAALIGILLIAAAVVPAAVKSANSPTRKSVASFGVPIAQADCAPSEDPPDEGSEHVPAGTHVDYTSVPPTSGRHTDDVLPRDPHFYPRGDNRAVVEKLVHNEQHGYPIVWYDATTPKAQVDALKQLGEKLKAEKFIAAPWDAARGAFPAGKHIGMATWGHKQLCGAVSGQAVGDFMAKFPPSQAPEGATP